MHDLITQKLLVQILINIHQYFEKNHLPTEQFTVGKKVSSHLEKNNCIAKPSLTGENRNNQNMVLNYTYIPTSKFQNRYLNKSILKEK